MVAGIGTAQIIVTAIHSDLSAGALDIVVAVGGLYHIAAMIAADCVTNNFPHGQCLLGGV